MILPTTFLFWICFFLFWNLVKKNFEISYFPSFSFLFLYFSFFLKSYWLIYWFWSNPPKQHWWINTSQISHGTSAYLNTPIRHVVNHLLLPFVLLKKLLDPFQALMENAVFLFWGGSSWMLQYVWTPAPCCHPQSVQVLMLSELQVCARPETWLVCCPSRLPMKGVAINMYCTCIDISDTCSPESM